MIESSSTCDSTTSQYGYSGATGLTGYSGWSGISGYKINYENYRRKSTSIDEIMPTPKKESFVTGFIRRFLNITCFNLGNKIFK